MSDTDTEPKKTNMLRALCYIFFLPLIFSVIEKNNKDLELDIRYGSMIFIGWFIISIIAGILNVGILVFLLYISGSGYLAFKAYNGQKIQLDVLDQVYESLTGKIKK